MRSKKYIVYVIIMLIIVSVGVSYSYFTTIIKGDKTPMTFKAAELKIVFTDSATLQATSIEPGWSDTKTFTVKNESDGDYNYNIVIKNLVNTFVTEGYLQYKITSKNGYEMPDYLDIPKSEIPTDTVLAYNVNIKKGGTQEYTIEFIYRNTEEDQSEDMGKQLSGTLAIVKGTEDPNKLKLKDKLLADNPTILIRTNFDNVFTDSNTGTLYKANGNLTEGGKDVYYFAGNAQNNWVKFGKDQDNADLYWRIIRTNEDGGVRLLYIGPDPATTSAFIKIDGTYMSGGSDTTGMYNSVYNNTMYVGYMYGTTGSLSNNRGYSTSAPIKTVTDKWYSKTINVKTDASGNTYDKYVSGTAIYCNDRSGDGYSNTSGKYMYYAGLNRLGKKFSGLSGNQPTYKCGGNTTGGYFKPETTDWINGKGSTLWVNKAANSEGKYTDANDADKFTKSTTTGNGKLTYPIAQITADEIAFAGGLFVTNAPAWYYYNSAGGSAVGADYWWTMSPSNFNSSNAVVFFVYGSSYPGHLGDTSVDNAAPGVRPVLSLKSCATYESGDGTSSSPYQVTIDNACSIAEN